MSPNPGMGGQGGMSGPGDFNQMGGWNPVIFLFVQTKTKNSILIWFLLL
jgi:hypothetical protein